MFKIRQQLSYLATFDEHDEQVSMPDAGDLFLAPNYNLGDTKRFIFFTFQNLIGFWEL